jgi:hypothetical protein
MPALNSKEAPGYFGYLVLTLLVASLPVEDDQLGGAFRRKLGEFLESERAFIQLQGVELMWLSLERWLDQRQAEGLAFRKLILPEVPESWSHIGITLRLAFPAKWDATLLKRFLSEHSTITDNPREFISRFGPWIESGRRSEGMHQAFKDFRSAFLSGNRFLADHYFWKLVRSCETEASSVESEAWLEYSLDEDSKPIFALVSSQSRMALRQGALSSIVAEFMEANQKRAGRSLLVFRQVGYGRWRSVPGDENIFGRVHLGCSADAYRRLREYRERFAPSGEWYFTIDPLPVAVADACVGLITGVGSNSERLLSVSVSGGILTHGLWLGRPAVMPRVSAGSGVIIARSGRGADGELRVEADPLAPGMQRLNAASPASGEWFLEPGDGSQSWSRRVAFARSAHRHKDLDAQAQDFPELLEWTPGCEVPAKSRSRPDGWDAGDPGMSDLTEAVYAGGRSGWAEADLVGLVKDVFGADPNPWAVIRSLCDASQLTSRLRPRWKGRIWTLGPPSLRRLGSMAIAEGAICESQAEDFRIAATSCGAEPFKAKGAVPTAPMLVGCHGGDLEALCDRLNWRLLPSTVRCDGQPVQFSETKLTTFGRVPASRWDWERRRFVADSKEGEGEVRLTRWSQPAGTDHDVYTVDDLSRQNQWRFVSRSAAVVAAHCCARLRLFTAADGFLVSDTCEGFLPDLVAKRLRLHAAANPGAFAGTYVYSADQHDLAWLGRILPHVVVSAPRPGVFSWDAISKSRHSRGRDRLAWRDGFLSVATGGLLPAGQRWLR